MSQKNGTVPETNGDDSSDENFVPGLPNFEDENHPYEKMLKKPAIGSLNTANDKQKLFLLRHGERVDFTFGPWLKHCFDANGTYIRKDLNMPKSLPERANTPECFRKDTPLTRIGTFQAQSIGESFKEKNITIGAVYCSPALRCLQTITALLEECNQKHKIKIKIEPGLFEWVNWYQGALPEFMTYEEYIAAGFNIDTDYKPLFTKDDLKNLDEDFVAFYDRNYRVTLKALQENPVQNVLLMGHATTLDVCSRQLIGKEPRTMEKMGGVMLKIPYSGLVQLEKTDGKWGFVEPPCPPITHSTNDRFDYEVLFK